MLVAYQLLRWLLLPIVRLLYSVKIEGRDEIPRKDGVIIASNHPRTRDPVMLGVACRRPIAFGANSDFFRWRGKGIVTTPLFRATGQFSVDRSGGRAAQRFVDAAVRHVADQQRVLGIFPEGWLSPPDGLHRLKNGVGRIAQRTGAPVVVAAVSYWPRTWRTCWRRPVVVRLSRLGYYGTDDPATGITARIDKAMQDLTGRPSTGAYASGVAK